MTISFTAQVFLFHPFFFRFSSHLFSSPQLPCPPHIGYIYYPVFDQRRRDFQAVVEEQIDTLEGISEADIEIQPGGVPMEWHTE